MKILDRLIEKYQNTYGLKRILLIACAQLIAWMIMFVAMVSESYDGLISLILMPIFSGIFAAIQIAISLAILLILKYLIRNLKGIYNAKMYLALILLSLFALVFGTKIGLPIAVLSDEFDQRITVLHPGIWYSANILISILIISFPVQNSKRNASQTSMEK